MSISPSSPLSPPSPSLRPSLRIGLIADVQHAPIDDGYSYSGTPRYYRHALSAATAAARRFQDEGVDMAIDLGDVIDGQAKDVEGGPKPVMESIVSSLSNYVGPWFHTYGNHEMYCFSRSSLSTLLSIPFTEEGGEGGDLVGYHSVVKGDYRFVFLDNYDETVLSREGRKRDNADEVLKKKNPNYSKGEINSPYPGTGLNRRFVAFNGGIGEDQLTWLRGELKLSRSSNQRVVICSHQPLHPSTTAPICLPFNYPKVLNLLYSYNDVVALTLSGHTHSNGYKENRGVHHLVVPAVLESPPPVNTYGILEFYDDRIEVKGEGDFQSRVMVIEEVGKEVGKGRMNKRKR